MPQILFMKKVCISVISFEVNGTTSTQNIFPRCKGQSWKLRAGVISSESRRFLTLS